MIDDTKDVELNYTSLDNKAIKNDIEARMLIDGDLKNFPDSSLGKMLIGHIGGVIDIANHNLETLANEMTLPFAKNPSSVIGKTYGMGYSIRRPVPSKALFKMSIKAPLIVSDGDYIHIPKFTKFEINGIQFLTKESYTRRLKPADAGKTLEFVNYYKTTTELGNMLLTSSDVSSLNDPSVISSVLNFEVLQGEIQQFTMNALDSNQRGTLKYQRYLIPDAEFSNIYGDADIYSDSITGWQDKQRCLTQVSVAKHADLLFSEETLYHISRTSFVDSEQVYKGSYKAMYQSTDSDKLPKVCVIRTTIDGGTEIIFGDDNLFSVPSDALGQIVGVRYLRTKGSRGNSDSVKGKKFTPKSEVFVYKKDGSVTPAFVEIELTTNAYGGQDIESLESIKMNLPSYYSTINRLVTKSDYQYFLNSIESPFKVKRSVVFGEQEYSNFDKKGYRYNNPLRNLVVFSVLGNLYNTESVDAKPLTPVLAYSSYKKEVDPNYQLNSQLLDNTDYDIWSNVGYYNILSRRDIISYRNRFEVARFLSYDVGGSNLLPTEYGLQNEVISDRTYDNTHPVKRFYEVLSSRAMLPINHIYIAPVIQNFDLVGEVYINDYADAVTTKRRIEKSIYTWLNEKTEFQKPIFRSQIEEIINDDKDVVYSNVEFRAVSDWSNTYDNGVFSAIESEFDCSSYIANATSYDLNFINNTDTCLKSTHALSYFPMFSMLQNEIDKNKFTDGSNTSNVVSFFVKRNSDGFLASSNKLPKTLQIRETADLLKGSIVKVKWKSDSIPFQDTTDTLTPELVGSIVNAQPVSIEVGKSYTISYPTQATASYDSTKLATFRKSDTRFDTSDWENGETYIDNSLWMVSVVFSDEELKKLELTKDKRTQIYLSSEVSKVGNIVSAKWIDLTNYDGNICKYYMGFCPERYIVDAIERALKSIYTELHGVMVCSLCSTPEKVDADLSSTIDKPHICEGCRCSYESHFATETIEGGLEAKTERIWKSILTDIVTDGSKKTYGSVYNREDVFKGLTEPQKHYDIAEYFNVVVPQALLACWDGEFSLEKKIHHRIGVSERWFYETLIKRIVNELRFYAYFNSQTENNAINLAQVEMIAKVLNAMANSETAFARAIEYQAMGEALSTGDDTTQYNTDLKTIGLTFVNNLKSIFDRSANVKPLEMTPNVEKFLTSNTFIQIIYKLHQGFSQAIRSSMLDKYGNIMNYSLPNEIAQITSRLVFRKRN